ncbi:MAG: beta family protein [Anaerolineaceae bacterium]
MITKLHKYIPCLRWKLGEYQAVSNLSTQARGFITPIIEVPEYGANQEFDYETRRKPKNIDQHLSWFTNRIKDKWGTENDFFLDMHHVPHNVDLSDGSSPSKFVFRDLKQKGISFTPVTRLHEELSYMDTLQQYLRNESSGICLRVSFEEFGDDEFESNADNLLRKFGVSFEDCDLVLDLEAMNFNPINVLSNLLASMIVSKHQITRWNDFGIIGTSFPQSLSGVKKGISFLPRLEWVLYKSLAKKAQEANFRLPTFGDYTINNPQLLTIDPRLLKSKANIRYTIDDNWLIARGENVRDYKFFQYHNLCQLIISSGYYVGPQFSFGDEYIDRCAFGKANTGNLSTWKWVGVNHHIEVVAKDVAKFVVS